MKGGEEPYRKPLCGGLRGGKRGPTARETKNGYKIQLGKNGFYGEGLYPRIQKNRHLHRKRTKIREKKEGRLAKINITGVPVRSFLAGGFVCG